ncbi:MAG: phosphatidate cytidylyltransferase, partial [Pseudomonadota bacterium]|nr:phosphatidate cytidylyltransferase [Pseudomonadota bacterium]
SCWSGDWLTSSINLSLVPALIAGVGISALAQLGDLSVSVVKRRYGVKDASGLIPGHGGMLDRLDGMLLTAPTLAVVLFVVDRGWI